MNIKQEILKRNENTLVSSYCWIAHNNELEAVLRERYGRDGLCLKIFPEEWSKLEDVTWGKVPLEEATVIQNLFATHGTAPRVYDLMWVNDKQAAQVTDFLESDGGEPDRERLLALIERYAIKHKKHADFAPRNWVGSKYIDFGGMLFSGQEEYERELVTRAYTRRGVNIGSAYQSVEGLSIHGQRDIAYRKAAMCLEDIDFQGKTVLDIGCNLGAFCQDAHTRGASRIIGIDCRGVPELAQEIANMQGFWNLDFLSLKLPRGDGKNQIRLAIGMERCDVVYFMAIANYVGGYAPWVADLCRDVLYVEGHGKEQPDQYRAALERDFQSVEFMGMTEDNYRRPLFRCRK